MNQANYSDIGLNIRKARHDLCWSQKTLSEKSGLTTPCISMIELGHNQNPGCNTILKIANALHVTCDDLIRGYQNHRESEARRWLIMDSLTERQQSNIINLVQSIINNR